MEAADRDLIKTKTRYWKWKRSLKRRGQKSVLAEAEMTQREEDFLGFATAASSATVGL